MNFFQRLKELYFKYLLPFENPEHPLYASPYEEPDYSDDEIYGFLDYIGIPSDELIGPNYARKPFAKPATYSQYGSKWYRNK